MFYGDFGGAKMFDKKARMVVWNPADGEDFEYAKKEILAILKEQKVSLSKVRALFNDILEDIEDNNPITL